jgi:hypothetical protein
MSSILFLSEDFWCNTKLSPQVTTTAFSLSPTSTILIILKVVEPWNLSVSSVLVRVFSPSIINFMALSQSSAVFNFLFLFNFCNSFFASSTNHLAATPPSPPPLLLTPSARIKIPASVSSKWAS